MIQIADTNFLCLEESKKVVYTSKRTANSEDTILDAGAVVRWNIPHEGVEDC